MQIVGFPMGRLKYLRKESFRTSHNGDIIESNVYRPIKMQLNRGPVLEDNRSQAQITFNDVSKCSANRCSNKTLILEVVISKYMLSYLMKKKEKKSCFALLFYL